jgi:radical SAM superfamily enzyme YgiQ (UPF0313 family)
MRILLIKPYNLSDHIQPPLGLGYLATACRDKNEVVIIDCLKQKLKTDKLLLKIKEMQPDLVGFQCYTYDLKIIKEVLLECKKLNPKLVTVIGGPHPSAAPRESFEYFQETLDYVFVGEAEKSFPMLIDYLEAKGKINLSEIPGLCWRDGANIRTNSPVFVEDLDMLGMPAWDLIHPEGYPESQHGAFFKNFPIAPIITTRGCPFCCTFCAGHTVGGRKLRKNSIDFVLKQIKYLYDVHKIREFHIIDDNFTFDGARAKELLRRLIDLNLKISWAVPNGVRLDTLDEELLALMKKSGLYLISLGIESGSNRVLKLIKKSSTVEKIRSAIEIIHKFNIDIAGFFVIGLPGETKEEIEETIRFSLGLGLIRANFFTYLPFPGTESYEELLLKGELDNINWDKFYFMNAAYAPRGMTRHQLKNLQRQAFLRFYLRPAVLWRNLLGIKSLKHFRYLLIRVYHWIILN